LTNLISIGGVIGTVLTLSVEDCGFKWRSGYTTEIVICCFFVKYRHKKWLIYETIQTTSESCFSRLGLLPLYHHTEQKDQKIKVKGKETCTA
jgi:hypothetical protein